VCFFSSYDYEQQVYKLWQTTGLLDKMNTRKKVCICVDLFLLTVKTSLHVRRFNHFILSLLLAVRCLENQEKPTSLIKYFRHILPALRLVRKA